MIHNGLDQSRDLLIDVKTLNFAKETVNSETDDSMTMDTTGNDNYFPEKVPDNVFLYEVPIKESLEKFKEAGKALKFKVCPIFPLSVAFVTGKGNDYNKLHTPALSSLDHSKIYKIYVNKLFQIYQDLGDDRYFSIPTIGLVSSKSRRQHFETVNLAVDALIDELELCIQQMAENGDFEPVADFEDCATIINCLRAVHCTLDSGEEDSRAAFFANLEHWVNRADGEPDETTINQVLLGNVNMPVYNSYSFWSLLGRLLMRGLFDQAIGVVEKSGLLDHLKGNCETSHSAITELILMVQQYPYESEEQFRAWKATLLQLTQTYADSLTQVDQELRIFILDILSLVSGNRANILRYSKEWFEAFCGMIMFYIPTLELAEEYLDAALSEHPLNVCNVWEQPCVDIIRGKIHFILPTLESLENATAAFVAAFCEAKGLLQSPPQLRHLENSQLFSEADDLFSPRNSMATYLLNTLAMELCCQGDRELWAVSIGLISLSPSDNESAKRLAIAELLPHFPFQTNDDVEWLLSICAEWHLPDVARTIHRILGNSLLYDNNVVEAMSNFSKAGEFEWVKHYAWMIFEASALQGAPLEDLVVNTIVDGDTERQVPRELLRSVATDAMRQALAPYAVLYQVYHQQRNEEWTQALNSLLALMEFKSLPKHYFVLLVAKFLYGTYVKDDEKEMSEEAIVRVLKVLDHLELDEKCYTLYEVCLSTDTQMKYPESLDELIRGVRRELGFKICREFIVR
ncbi:LAMI_0H06612g1_1 [Lachancea mirantina]|uniref:Nuclear pore complex protein Nup85 n=1 Tax=Lachancea mirantina TaxID=1230905 RepID=A0A1G4KFN6_9SACH|nr:LAMI_0H06612g1_1 [Lachancea mirantina]